MHLTNREFVIGLTSDFWATIYRKRLNPRTDDFYEKFDLAAEINQQGGCFGWYDQDQVVKQLFRDMVEYVMKVFKNKFSSYFFNNFHRHR